MNDSTFNPDRFYYMSEEIVRGDLIFQHTDFDNSYNLLKGSKPAEPVRFKYKKGSRQKDVIIGGGQVFLLSIELIEELRKYNLKGWDTFKINASEKEGNPLEGYEGLFITGTAGSVERSFSKEILRPNAIGIMKPVYVGPGLDPLTWDGSDIFSLEGTIHIIVSQQVKDIFKQFKTNISNSHVWLTIAGSVPTIVTSFCSSEL